MRCKRCYGSGEVKLSRSVQRCPVCLGLGHYETNPAFARRYKPEGFMALHSNVPIEDVIALLSERRNDERSNS